LAGYCEGHLAYEEQTFAEILLLGAQQNLEQLRKNWPYKVVVDYRISVFNCIDVASGLAEVR